MVDLVSDLEREIREGGFCEYVEYMAVIDGGRLDGSRGLDLCGCYCRGSTS